MISRTDNPAEVGMHVFERAGLGKAPFRCIGVAEKFITHPDGTTQAAGSCAFCGQGIRYVYTVIGRDQRPFNVGCDCVERTGDAGLIKSYKQRPEVRAMARAKAKARDDRVIAEWNALIDTPEAIECLTGYKVAGRPWIPGEQITAYEDFKRIWNRCGASGRARTLRLLKQRLNGRI
jgi:hypothetical protein